MAAGMPAEEARRQALIAFGGVVQTRESLRQVHGSRFREALAQDARYGWRMLRKTPGFTAIAVLTLALGIGANTAIFSLIDAIIFRSLPVADPESLVVFQWHARSQPQNHSHRSFGDCDDVLRGANLHGCSLPLPYFRQVHDESGVFERVAAFTSGGQLDLSGNGPAKMVRGEYISGDYFPTLGIRAHLGRLIAPADDAPDAPAVAVLNYGFWQSDFGGSPSAVGKTIRLNGTPVLIVGVAEPRFQALTISNKYDLWVPMAQRPTLIQRWNAKRDQMDSWWLIMIGRVKPGVPVGQAQAAVSLLFHNDVLKDGKMLKPESEPGITLVPASQVLGGSQSRTLGPLYVMMLCVAVVLLIACANVAGLMLARSAVRQREIAVRLALGARRGRIILQLLTESVMLALAGGALGLVIAVLGAKALMLMVSSGTGPALFSPQLDWRVLAFSAAVSLLTGIVFGLAPALRGSDISLTSSLKTASDGSVPQGRTRRVTTGGMLVAAQMALAIVVLVTAGLLVRTLSNLKNLNPGFDTHSLLVFGIDPTLAGYKGPQIDTLYNGLQEKFSALPGVSSVTYSEAPLLYGSLSTTDFHKPGTPKESKDSVDSDLLPVGPHFFSTLHIPFLAGRDFTSADFTTAAANAGDKPGLMPTPVVANQAFVESYYHGQNPLGQIFGENGQDESGRKEPGYVIVGVVGNAKYNSLRREIHPTFYFPNTGGNAYFELRTAADPLSLVPAIKNIVNHENQDLALFRVATQQQAIDLQVFSERIIAQLSSFFGVLALVLACLGLYGLLSYEVTRRTREIGIRMDVGAQSHDVIRMVLAKGAALICGGAAIGIAVALAVTRFLSSFLYGVKAGDPTTLAAVAVLLALVALAACYIPAHRATRVDPLVTLRYE